MGAVVSSMEQKRLTKMSLTSCCVEKVDERNKITAITPAAATPVAVGIGSVVYWVQQ